MISLNDFEDLYHFTSLYRGKEFSYGYRNGISPKSDSKTNIKSIISMLSQHKCSNNGVTTDKTNIKFNQEVSNE